MFDPALRARPAAPLGPAAPLRSRRDPAPPRCSPQPGATRPHRRVDRPPPRLRALGAASLALWLAVSGPPTPSPAHAAGRVYRNDALRILALEIPRGYATAPQVSWPGVLVIATGSGKSAGARLVAAAQKVIPGQEALSLAAEARAGLLKQGFRDPRVSDRAPGTGGESRAQVDGFYDRERPARRGDPPGPQGPLVLRQLYVVSGDVAVVLTITVPQESSAAALLEFNLFAESLVIAPMPLGPAPAEPRPDVTGAPDASTPPGAPANDGGAAGR